MTVSENQDGLLFTLVGPGGAGKNALMRVALANLDNLSQLATATTRSMREDEEQGREHLFVSYDVFQAMIRDNKLLEYQEVTPGRFYGIPRASVEDKINVGKDLIADIEVIGAKILRDRYPNNVVLIFITVPGETEEEKLEILKARMSVRDGIENAAVTEQRLKRARELEFPFAAECDYIIVNDDKESAGAILQDIIIRERSRRTQNVM